MIATGSRPRPYPNFDELNKVAITSDDLFSLKEEPGDTLIIGGGYIALECAGFLCGLGKKVTMINRSTFLRQMDQDASKRIVTDLVKRGVSAHEGTVPIGIKKIAKRRYEVELQQKENKHKQKIEVNTILMAIGRDPNTQWLDAENGGLLRTEQGKIRSGDNPAELERTHVDHIYAIGDSLDGVPELQTVAKF